MDYSGDGACGGGDEEVHTDEEEDGDKLRDYEEKGAAALHHLSETADTVEQANWTKVDQGEHECEISYGGEADLHKHKKDCKKYPTHDQFIPYTQFSLEHLPEPYRKLEIFQDLQLHAQLTGRIRVNYISKDRPKTYPDSKKPFPFHNHRGKHLTMTGTGWVDRVIFFKKPRFCTCKLCVQSADQHILKGQIRIRSAQHVIFDNSEAKELEFELFYDDDADTSEVCTLYGTGTSGFIKQDCCRIFCSTHDEDLLYRLAQMVDQCKYLHSQVFHKYRDENHTLTVIISHPHGCNKQVTIGEWTKKNVKKRTTCYMYTTNTCPGSSGAPVWMLGRGGNWDTITHPHSSGLKNGKNKCAYGYDQWTLGQK